MGGAKGEGHATAATGFMRSLMLCPSTGSRFTRGHRTAQCDLSGVLNVTCRVSSGVERIGLVCLTGNKTLRYGRETDSLC